MASATSPETNPATTPLPAEMVLLATARMARARASATHAAYARDWADYGATASRAGLAMPPTAASLGLYVDQIARRGAKLATIRRRLAGINFGLKQRGLPPISVRTEPLASIMQGVARDLGERQRQARPIELADLRALAVACGDDPKGVRDRAIMLLGFAAALRRSEIVGLDWQEGGEGSGWIEWTPEGLRVHLKRSKTNQTGRVETIAVCRGRFAATCPVEAMLAWQACACSGPVFRPVDRHGNVTRDRLSGGGVARMLKARVARAARAGGATACEIAAAVERTSGHSLRAGLVTTAFGAGVAAEDIMRQTRHRRVTTLLSYRRHATDFVANVSGRVGL